MFDKCGNVDPTLHFAIDYELFVRFMQAGGKFVRLDRFSASFASTTSPRPRNGWKTVGKQGDSKRLEQIGLKAGRLDKYRSARFYYGALRRGGEFAKGYRLPGALPGVGVRLPTTCGADCWTEVTIYRSLVCL